MPSGLIALLDDVAAIAKLAATSLDDVAAAAGKAGAKAAGVVVDDAAVTPKYVHGLSPQRELPIIWKITKGSLKNKLIFLLPAALLLAAFAPWAITPLLMLGGAYLCYEGAEKLAEALGLAHHDQDCDDDGTPDDPAHLEEQRVGGAIRTDFILSAEIMAIALASVSDKPIWEQGLVLALVAVAITFGVYGAVALIVKLDDIGLHMVQHGRKLGRAIGRGLIVAMPKMMALLSTVGTAAMLWVGGQIELHGLAGLGWHAPEDLVKALAHSAAAPFGAASGVVEWLVEVTAAAIVGIIVGVVVIGLVKLVTPLFRRGSKSPAH